LSISEGLMIDGAMVSIFNDGRYVYVPGPDAIHVFEPVRR